MSLIEVKNAIKTYSTGDSSFNALNDVSLSVEDGEFVAIMGTSGSGKSTFMNRIAEYFASMDVLTNRLRVLIFWTGLT